MPDPEAPQNPEIEVKDWNLVKTDAETGEVFEVVEGGAGKPTVATFRKEGQPPESYAEVPYRPKEVET